MNSTPVSRVLVFGITLIVLVALMVGPVWNTQRASAAGSTLVVNSTLDSLSNDGQCTLREAIIAANKNSASGSKPGECGKGSGADTITFQFPASIALPVIIKITKTDSGREDASSSGDLDIVGPLTIQGPGADKLTVEAISAKDRVFHLINSSSDLTLSGMTVKGGKAGGSGGGFFNNGRLTLSGVVITGNTASADGGGIFNAASGFLTIDSSTVNGNTATTNGGGISAPGGTVTILNSTIANNTSKRSGGGIASGSTASLNNATIAFNTATTSGGGVFVSGSSLSLRNTLLGGNKVGAILRDCTGTLNSQGYNLIQSPTGCTVTGDLTGNRNADPMLAPLTNNGGPTPTLALLDGSPAIDAGSKAAGSACQATDQRGIPRPRGAACDIGAYESGLGTPPVMIRAFAIELTPGTSATRVVGRIDSQENATFTINFYYNTTCDPNNPGTLMGTTTVSTDGSGSMLFLADVSVVAPIGSFITAIAYDANGNPSYVSDCVRMGYGNDSWPKALELDPTDGQIATVIWDDYVDLEGQSRWYKIKIAPGSKLTITLTNLPDNYDLTVYKDISQAFKDLQNPQDLLQLSAEFAPDSFSPDIFSPDIFSPDSFSPDIFSPDSFSPDSFSPDIFSPDIFSPDIFSPDSFSPDIFSPDSFSPDSFSPDSFSPDSFSTDAYYPDIFSPDSFSSAQTRSIVAVSAFDGTMSEGARVNTWENTGDYYFRIRGRNGAYSLNTPFRLSVTLSREVCQNVTPLNIQSDTTIVDGDYETIILTDMGRFVGTATEKADVLTRLQSLASRSEVKGVIIDTGADDLVAAYNAQSDGTPTCPYGRNLSAEAIKSIVDRYWAVNPLRYVVIVGNDDVIPFFRYPDNAGLANERNYVPPVLDNTTSQASLRMGYLLTQDPYGSRTPISQKTNTLWMPELAVGRLVETAAEVNTMLDAYLGTANGTVNTPTSALVTGYDFLSDTATAIQGELEAGLGAPIDTLIDPRGLSPEDPSSWDADELRSILLGSRHDLIALAGHFSAATTLAADYETRFTTAELLASNVDMINSIIFSPGCHSGYNVVNAHAVPNITLQPDWAQAFALKGATLIAGTGYQYGDTDFIEYSERLYWEFSKQLRAGSGPISVGEALVKAKQVYLAETAQLRGIHEKSLLIPTLFGLPMLKVDLPPAGRLDQADETPQVTSPTLYGANPGNALGLRYANLPLNFTLTENQVELFDPENPAASVWATYLSGTDGVITRPGEPTLPLEFYNVSVPNLVLRGVGFRGGSYTDVPNILPLNGAPTTEVRGVHTPFTNRVFYPIKLWDVNYYDALLDPTTGVTNLFVTPAHIQTPDPTTSYLSTLRRFYSMDFRLFYSDHFATSTIVKDNVSYTSTPALSAAPAIILVNDLVGPTSADFDVRVAGNPAAGIQEVWITYTDRSKSPLQWQSINLTQNPDDSTRWQGSLPLAGTAANNIRYIVQAVNGVGLVSMDTNLGVYYTPGVRAGQTKTPVLEITSSPGSGAYGTQAPFSAVLKDENGIIMPGQPVVFDLGPQNRMGITDPNGQAQVNLPLLVSPGLYEVQAFFPGNNTYRSVRAYVPFTIIKQLTNIALTPNANAVYPGQDSQMVATLKDATDRALVERTVIFVVTGSNGLSYRSAMITDYIGRAPLGIVPLPKGTYTVEVFFNGVIPLPGGGSISLDDERYQPGYVMGSLTLLDTPPAAVDETYSMNEDTTLSVSAPGVLANDTDIDGDGLTAGWVSPPANGSLTLNTDGSFSYTPAANFYGVDSFSYQAYDGELPSNTATVTITIADVPENVCQFVQPSQYFIWPPNNNNFIPVNVIFTANPGVIYTVTVTGIFQDEPVGSGNHAPDAYGLGGSTAYLRTERDQNSDGRVYHIFFTAVDPNGVSCIGEVRTAVYDNQSQSVDPALIDQIDGGALFDSTLLTPN